MIHRFLHVLVVLTFFLLSSGVGIFLSLAGLVESVLLVNFLTGLLYYGGAFLLGIWLLVSSFRMAFRLESCSRAFFRDSVLYLSLFFLLMLVDRRFV